MTSLLTQLLVLKRVSLLKTKFTKKTHIFNKKLENHECKKKINIKNITIRYSPNKTLKNFNYITKKKIFLIQLSSKYSNLWKLLNSNTTFNIIIMRSYFYQYVCLMRRILLYTFIKEYSAKKQYIRLKVLFFVHMKDLSVIYMKKHSYKLLNHYNEQLSTNYINNHFLI